MEDDQVAIDDVVIQLTKDVIWVRSLWEMHEALYCSSEERFHSIQDSIGFISNLTRHSILVEMQLSICRMSDPAKSGKDKNVTLHQLAKIAENENLPDISKKALESAKMLDEAIDNIKVNRNKLLAHSDLKNLKEKKSNSHHNVSLDEIEKCIKIIENCLCSVSDVSSINIILNYEENRRKIQKEVSIFDTLSQSR